MQACTSPSEQEQTSGAKDRGFHEEFSCEAALGHQPSKTHGCAKRGGRPVTWIGGGGLDPKRLASLGVPVLRELFKEVFGESTASNNAGWLRRKLSESPDGVHGQCRSRVVRARDSGAAIWNRPLIMLGVGEEAGDEELAAAAADAEGQGEAGGCAVGSQALSFMEVEVLEAAGLAQGFNSTGGCVKRQQHAHRSLKRSCTEASQSFQERVAAARCPSPSASGSAGTHQDGCLSPGTNSRAVHKLQHHLTQQQRQHSGALEPSSSSALVNSCVPGHVIHPDELGDDWVGCRVMVFWPADNMWWAATICGLSTARQQLQLLYTDQTEEMLTGQDFRDLLCKGHLALAAGQVPPSSSATGYTISAHTNGPAAAAAACGSAMLSAPAGQSGPADLATVAAGSGAGDGLAVRGHSCQGPTSLAGSGSMGSQQDVARSGSVGLGVNYGVSGVNHAVARVSVTGSGNGSASVIDYEELAAKRMCYEPSINTAGSDGSTPAEATAFLGSYGNSGAVAAAAEQQQGPHAAQLGAWFASQQRQQQQLQLQMQANLQLQQQVQLQIQHQVAAHMSMQQAAGQLMQLQQPSLSSPFAGASHLAAAPPAGFAVMPADLGSSFMVAGGYSSAGPVAAAAGTNMAVPCQQAQQVEVQFQQSADPAAAAAGVAVVSSSALSPMHQQVLQQPQQQVAQRSAGCGGSKVSPRACDHVVPDFAGPAPAEPHQRQAAAAAAAVSSAALPLPQLNCQAPAGKLHLASVSEMAGLLTKAGPDIFEMAELAAAAGINSMDGMNGMGEVEEDAIAAACGLDAGGDACSSGNNSLCESMADELAVAGLEAQDAAGYYMFGCAGSPRREQQQELQQQVLRQGTAATAGAGAGGCQGLEYAADGQGVAGGGAAAAAACGGAAQLAGHTFKVSQAPCESSFAHMFDFY